MGVLGLTPFLRGSFPEVIRHLPDRLKSLDGKTIAIDATLVTQRLHFGNVPHEYRHILGWYRVLSELRDHGKNVICVFDGKERSQAKSAEVARRQAYRHLQSARAAIEQSRSQRLKNILDLVQKCDTLPAPERAHAYDTLLQRLAARSMTPMSLPPLTTTSPPSFAPRPSATRDDDAIDVENDGHEEQLPSPPFLPAAQLSVNDDNGQPSNTTSPYGMSQRQHQMTLEETQVLLSLSSLSSSESAALPPSTTSASASASETETEIPSTSFQEALAKLHSLASRSEALMDTYQLRSTPPSEQTYEECKMMIEAMGVPWIEAPAPYEAEALASSLVINGIADYVASEDTDVLVYRAPLLRNITNRTSPLTLMSGPEICSRLGLSHSSFVDFAVLIGTDFSQRIKGLGPQRALKLIRSHHTIENILSQYTSTSVNDITAPSSSSTTTATATATTTKKFPLGPHTSLDQYLAQVSVARLVFTTLPPLPPSTSLVPKMAYNAQLIQDILDQYGLARLADSPEDNDNDAGGDGAGAGDAEGSVLVGDAVQSLEELFLQTDFFASRRGTGAANGAGRRLREDASSSSSSSTPSHAFTSIFADNPHAS